MTTSLLVKQLLITVYSLIVFLVSSFLEGKISVPIVFNTSISSVALLKSCMKQGIDISSLNSRNISWLAYLSISDKPAGVIHNATDTVVWLNSKSRLKIGTTTTKHHIDNGRLIKIRDTVNNLNDIGVEDREHSYLELSYLLQFEKQVQVRDRFCKMVVGHEVFRIFECLESKEI